MCRRWTQQTQSRAMPSSVTMTRLFHQHNSGSPCSQCRSKNLRQACACGARAYTDPFALPVASQSPPAHRRACDVRSGGRSAPRAYRCALSSGLRRHATQSTSRAFGIMPYVQQREATSCFWHRKQGSSGMGILGKELAQRPTLGFVLDGYMRIRRSHADVMWRVQTCMGLLDATVHRPRRLWATMAPERL